MPTHSSILVFNNPASSIWGWNLLTHPLTIQSLASPFPPTSLHFQLSQIILSLGLPTFFLPAQFLSKISPGTLVSFLLPTGTSHTSHFLLISTFRPEVLHNSCNSHLFLVYQTSCSITDPNIYTEMFNFRALNITSSFSSMYFIQHLNWFYQYFVCSNFLYSAKSLGLIIHCKPQPHRLPTAIQTLISSLTSLSRSWDSLDSIMTTATELYNQEIVFWYLTGTKDLFFLPSIQMGPAAHPSSYSVGTWSSFSGVTGWSMKLTNHLQQVPRLWMSGSTPLLLPYSFMVGTFKFCLRLDKLLISLINLALFSFSSNESF